MSKKPISPDGEIVAGFLARIVGDLYSGAGVSVSMSDLKVVAAGKKITRADAVPVLQTAFVRLEQKHPEILDVVLIGLGESLKERIRKAAGRSDPIDAEKA